MSDLYVSGSTISAVKESPSCVEEKLPWCSSIILVGRKKPHELAEIFVCIIMGLLAGKTTLRRIVRWCRGHLEDLREHMPFPNGVPSLSTMSRTFAAVDAEMVSLAIINGTGEISDIRGIHIAIDGKGLRVAAHKVRDERTSYILNAIDVASRLVIAQLAIKGKTNEAATP